MKRLALLSGLAALAACQHSQKPVNEPPSSPAPAAQAATGRGSGQARPTVELDANALAALDRMGAYLSSLQEFAVRGLTTKDELLESGQKIQFSRTVDLWVKRPKQLRVDVSSDRQRRQFFYDGNTFTLYAPRMGYYASFQAPPTIRQLIDVLEGRYDVEMPLVDLFYFGAEPTSREAIRSAIRVGPSTVGDVATEQYAFQQDEVDWQLWIERGERPLPRKFVITTKTEPEQPQFVAVLAWNLQPALNPGSFAFVPPQGATQIVFERDRLDAAPSSPGGP